jgi:predicted permease
VTAEFFQALGVAPLAGRTIRSGEDVAGGFRSVVLSHGFWQSRFGSAPDVLGRVLMVNGSAHEIVGVMPANVSFPGVKAELFIPLPLNLSSPTLGRNLMTVARLKQGISIEAAQTDMERVAAELAAARPDVNAGYSATVMPLMEHAVGDSPRLLWVLFGSVMCLLLLACANVANLLLMRATTRTAEMSVRLALGAGRWRLLHQLIVESLVLTLAAGAIGLAMAWGIVPRIPALFPDTFPLPRANELTLDGSVVLFTLIVSTAVGLIFGIIPAIHSGGRELADAIRGSSRAVAGTHARARRGLVVVEMALALVLVFGAGLMTQSLMQLYRVKPGFDTEQVLSLRMLLVPAKYQQAAQRITFLRNVIDRVRAAPGVIHASSVHFLPLSGVGSSSRYYRRDRPEPPPEAAEGHGGHVSIVTDGYFQTMGIPLLKGRDFTALDYAGGQQVVIVSETLARQWYRDESPLGKHLSISWSTPEPLAFEIVGVAGDVRTSTIDEAPGPAIYLAQTQQPSAVATLVVRTSGPPAAVAPAVRAAIAQVDPDQGVSQVQSLETVVASTTARPRIQALVLGMFGFLALLIASIGLYGVMSYAVEQRRREIGVRLALGAAPARLLRQVVSEALALAAIGIAIGGVIALGATPVVSDLLYETQATDARVLSIVAATLFGVAALAAAVPAHRATRVDPAIVLRDQ